MELSKVRLEMARDRDFPEGSPSHGYEFVAPLDAGGRIDAGAWHGQRHRCGVTRFWGSEDHEQGHLVRKPGGSWAFHYDIHGDADDDESGYRFGDHTFRPGEYVSIRDHGDELKTFKVVSVKPVW
jgi:hypothetical protein